MEINKLQSITTDDKQIIPFYNNKQIYLGVLVWKKNQRGSEYKVVGPVITYDAGLFGTVKDVLTNEVYNSFEYNETPTREVTITSNKICTDLAHAFYDVDPKYGVVPYNSVYKHKLFDAIEKYLEENELQSTPQNINYAVTKFMYEEIRNIMDAHLHEVKEDSTTRVLK